MVTGAESTARIPTRLRRRRSVLAIAMTKLSNQLLEPCGVHGLFEQHSFEPFEAAAFDDVVAVVISYNFV